MEKYQMTTKTTKKVTANKTSTKTTTNTIEKRLIGQPVIVRANVAGVHFGILKAVDFTTQTVLLENAYRLWRIYTRDVTGSISDVAANGLKEPLSQHSIGARLDEVLINNPQGLEIALCSACVLETIQKAAPK
jgi:hypothetical protein